MELHYYLEDIELDHYRKGSINRFSLAHHVVPLSKETEINERSIGILGVYDDRIEDNEGSKNAPDIIRKYLYKLYSRPGFPQVIDFGNVIKGNVLKDTEMALSFVLDEMLSKNIYPIVIGPKYFAHILFKAINKYHNNIHIASIEPTLSLEINQKNEHSYLEKIILNKQNGLYNFSNIGYQAYLVSHKDLELIQKLNLDAFRLGFVRNNLLEIEPVLRDADMLFLDITSIKQSDAPGSNDAQPNGFYSEEICQLAKFAGMSNRCKLFSLFDVNPEMDFNDQTSKLAAQITWHFLEGFAQWKNDQPTSKLKETFTEFLVHISGIDEEIKFLKHKTSLRWWIQIPEKYTKSSVQQYFACSSSDYQNACKNEVPHRLLDYIKRSY